MRSTIRAALIADVTLTNLIPAVRWIDSSAMEDSPPTSPFAVLRYGEVTRQISGASFGSVRIWIHDRPGSYAKIEQIQRRIRTVLEATPATSINGLIEIKWEGDGEDLSDPAYRTVSKVSTFKIVGTTL